MDKQALSLQPARLGLATAKERRLVADIESGTTLADILKAEYWRHVAKFNLTPNDIIIARAEDGTWRAELIVQATGPGFAKVKLLQKYDLEVEAPGNDAIPPGYSVLWKGPQRKWVALHETRVLREGFDSRTAASAWLGGHLKTIAA